MSSGGACGLAGVALWVPRTESAGILEASKCKTMSILVGLGLHS